MKRVARWIGFGLGMIAGLAAATGLVLYVLSERILRRTYDVPLSPISVPTDSGSIAEGRRLALVHGCTDGCHAPGSRGQVFFDEAGVARLVAPNLTATVRKYNDAELARIIRHGIRPDGRSVFAMPAETFNEMSDADLGRILAFLRSLPQGPGPGPSLSVGPLGRLGLVTGKFKSAAQLITETVPPPDASTQLGVRGRYLARTICTECHGTDLRGDPSVRSVDLGIVSAYSPEQFHRLLRTAVPLDGRKLGLMAEVVAGRFVYLTEDEITALYEYLHGLSRSGG